MTGKQKALNGGDREKELWEPRMKRNLASVGSSAK